MLARVLGELIPLIGVFRQQSNRRIGSFTRRAATCRRELEGSTALCDGIVEVQHSQKEIGPVPVPPGPLAGASRQPGIEDRPQARILQPASGESRNDVLRRQGSRGVVNAPRGHEHGGQKCAKRDNARAAPA
jgi:hypothetical protein